MNGYSLDKIEHPSELGAEISVDWKLLEITKNEPLQEDTSSNENIMSAEEVYEKLAEHYAQERLIRQEMIWRLWKAV